MIDGTLNGAWEALPRELQDALARAFNGHMRAGDAHERAKADVVRAAATALASAVAAERRRIEDIVLEESRLASANGAAEAEEQLDRVLELIHPDNASDHDRLATPADEAGARHKEEVEALYAAYLHFRDSGRDGDKGDAIYAEWIKRVFDRESARAASAVPEVVRDEVVKSARVHREMSHETWMHPDEARSHGEKADALDAWLRATAGAESGAARATEAVVAAARRFVQARYGIAASPLARDPAATYDRAAKLEGDAWDALHRAVWELDDLESEGEEVGSTNPVSTTNPEDPMSQQQTAPGAGRPVTDEQLHHWFTYHAPSGNQLESYQAVRDAGKAFATIIRDHCPPGADTTSAIRKVREAVMTANAAIACEGR